MAATSAIDTPSRPGSGVYLPLAAATIIYQGTQVCVNSSGYAVSGADTAGLRAVGRAAETVDNTDGSAGDLSINVDVGVFRFDNSATAAVDADDIGKVCYVEDNQTVAETSTNLVKAGKVFDVDSDGVWVDTRGNLKPTASHEVVLGSLATLTGGAASEAVTVTGALSTDIVVASVTDNLSNNDLNLLEAKPSADTVTLLFNEDPGAGAKVSILVLRATT